jgi:predicted GNAT superfamily acetyltransferase
MTDRFADHHLMQAQERANVEVRLLVEVDELMDAQALFDRVWPAANGSTQLATNLMRAVVHSGGYTSVAYRDEQPIGAAFGWVGRHRAPEGWRVHLHSHMAAVLDGYRDQHVGSALKLHQRAWALSEDIDTIVWTFDPLVRRNARLNLIKLGVDVDGFEPNFYGAMNDGINSGDPTDRLFAWWHVDSERVHAALGGELTEVDLDVLRADGRDVRDIALPDDIVAIRQVDPDAAREWRMRLRHELQSAFADGYRITAVATHGGFVMERTS